MEARVLAALALLALVSAQPLAAALSAAPATGVAGVGVAEKARAALEALLEEARQAGVNLTIYNDTISEAYRLIDEAAAAEARGDVAESVRLVAQAMSLVKHVLVEVKVEVEVEPVGLHRAKRVLVALNESGVPVPPEAFRAIEEALRAAKGKHGGVPEELIVRAREKIAWTVREHVKHTLVIVAAGSAAIERVVESVSKTIVEANYTLQLIEEGRLDEASRRLERIGYWLEALSARLDAIAEAAAKWGANETVVATIRSAASGAASASSLMFQAASLLGENDTLGAEAAILDAIRVLEEEVIAPLSSLEAEFRIVAVKGAMEMHIVIVKRMHAFYNQSYQSILIVVNVTIANLEKMLEKYQSGLIPAQAVKSAFQHALERLEKLRASLPSGAPEEVVMVVDNAIEWIKANMPQDEGQAPGHGHRRP